MAKRRRSRRKSSIDKLPVETREKLVELMTDPYNGMTLMDMREYVEEECGITLSVSALSRFSNSPDIQRVRTFNEQVTRELAQVRKMLERDCPADVSVMIMALIQDGLMRRIQEGQEELFNLPIKDVIAMSMQAARTATYVYRYRDQHVERAEVDGAALEAERMNWLRQALRGNPDLLWTILREVTSGGMVCAAGDDGNGARVPEQGGEGGVPGALPDADHAGAAQEPVG